VAHERAILDRWTEDDGVYMTLRATSVVPREPVSGSAAAGAEPDSPAAPAFLPLPTPR
jgi:hypothetical protein